MKNGTTIKNDGTVEIRIPLNPYTKKNSQEIHWRYVRGERIPYISPSAAYKAYAADCQYFLKPVGIGYPVNVKAEFFMAARRKVDLSNLCEAIHDILVMYGVLADDNAKIVVSMDGSRVYYDEEKLGYTEITITKTEPTIPC